MTKMLALTILASILCLGMVIGTIMKVIPPEAMVGLCTFVVTHVIERRVHESEVRRLTK